MDLISFYSWKNKDKIKLSSLGSYTIDSDLVFSDVKSIINERRSSSCFGNIIHHFISWIQSSDLASVSDTIIGTVLRLTGLLLLYSNKGGGANLTFQDLFFFATSNYTFTMFRLFSNRINFQYCTNYIFFHKTVLYINSMP